MGSLGNGLAQRPSRYLHKMIKPREHTYNKAVIDNITGMTYVQEANYTNTNICHRSDTCSPRHVATYKHRYTIQNKIHFRMQDNKYITPKIQLNPSKWGDPIRRQ